MKKIIGATVALALSGALCACSNSSGGGTTPDASAGGTSGTTGGTSGTTGGTSGTTGGTTGSTGGAKATGGATGTTGGTTGSGGSATGGTAGDSGADSGAPHPPPVLGDQIDRMGRPGVNTALTDPFDIYPSQTEDQVKDAYNAAKDPSTWAASFQTDIETNLAIINSLDRNCENQFAESPKTDAGLGRYSALAGVLVDDQLYVKTDATVCSVYLGVEANATTLIPNSDCGGRTLTEDVIDETYSALAIGKLTGVSDDVDFDSPGVTDTFPFLAPPQ